METLIRDLGTGAKLLWKSRGFAGTVVLTLAVCVGANIAIFTIVNSVLLKPLPLPESDRLLFISNQYPGAGVPDTFSVGIPDYIDRRRQLTVFEEEAMYRSEDRTIEINGVPERVRSMRVTPSFFRVLQISPAIGRAFTDDEGTLGNEDKVILSEGLWQQLYGGNPSIVGQTMRIGGRPYTIVGVMPRGFDFGDPEIRLWTSYAFTENEKSDNARHSNNSSEIGRLKPGATLQQAQSQVDAFTAANLERFPKLKDTLINAGFRTQVRSLHEVFVLTIRKTLYLLWGGAALVLLIGGVNIGNLVLARANVRRKELATRLALGAARFHVARHLLAESCLLGLGGGLGGLAVGIAALPALGAIGLDRIPRASEIHIDTTVVAFALAISIGVGVLIGLVPVAQLSRINLSTALREETRSGTGGKGARTVRRALVVAQVALACVLLIGSGLLLVSFRQLLAVDPGFKTAGVLTVSTAAPIAKYPKPDDARRFMNRTLEAVRTIPGVSSAGATNSVPFGGNFNKNVILAEGYVMKPGESLLAPMQVSVSPGYFEAMGTRLKRGRFFTEQDTGGSPRVVIVDERLARRFWPDTDPLGRRLFEPSDEDLTKIDPKASSWTVVGVIEDMRLAELAGKEQPLGTYYFSLNQSTSQHFTIAAKSTVDQAALTKTLRHEMMKIDPDVPLFDIRTMDERTRLSLTSQRAALVLGLVFGGVALFLAAIGIYGVLAYLVAQRTREIGIRIALGSSAVDVFKLVLREGIVLVSLGLALGVAGSASIRTFLESQIYGVRPMDPFVLATVMLGLTVVALAACAIPARGATRVDPVQVLNG
jgi:predicted permease